MSLITSSYEENAPGLHCSDHRSSWCEHCIEIYEQREDAEMLARAIEDGCDVGASILWVTVPVFPNFCVWETVGYDCRHVQPFGPMAVIDGTPRPHLRVIERIMPGESASGLQQSLLMDFMDQFDLIIESSKKVTRSRADAPAWRCRATGHSLRYQQLVEASVSPSKLASPSNTQFKQAMIYCLTRWNLCLFCKVNKHNRDAVRVNPTMAEVMGSPTSQPADNNFDDLVPW